MIDLCSIANISIMFFDSPLHGYYIHGYNPSKRSDTNLHGLMNILKEESTGKTQKRGLESKNPNPEVANLQTYEIFIDSKMRKHYDDVLSSFIQGFEPDTVA